MLSVLTALALATLSPVAADAPAESAFCAPMLISVNARGGSPVLDAALIDSLGPEQLLRGLERLPREDLREFVATGDDVLEDLIANQPAPGDVRSWWAGLDFGERLKFETVAPELVGNLDGVPYDVRDSANRRLLEGTLAGLRSRLSAGIGKGAGFEAVSQLRMLEQVQSSLDQTADGPTRRLLVLDTAMPGRAAVSLGELDSADYVSFLVPGALLSVREHMSEWTKVTADIYDSQTSWQTLLGEHSTVATVSWIGYQTPDVTNVFGLDLAEQGADFMSGTVNGLRALREGNEPYVSVFAHSYGATAVTLALQRGEMAVDALAMIGSPGGDAQSADDLGIPADRVWVGEAAWDPVVDTAFFGTDPGSADFGAHPMGVNGAVDPVTGQVLTASVGHDWYLEPGTESLRNLSLIGIDRGELVTDGSVSDVQKTLALSLADPPRGG